VVRRDAEPQLRSLARRFPVVTVMGPRQSGKTTLCRGVFGKLPYRSLETPDTRDFAELDPRGFLAELRHGAVLDEVQRAPQLLSYLQEIVDARGAPRPWVLTGSWNFALLATVSQSLAGRSAVLHLLPPSWDELLRFPRPPKSLREALWTGAYPRIHDQRLPAADFLSSYVATYVERDVRQMLNVGDLRTFQTFLQLCAARSGQLLNLSSLGADAGVSQPTARKWISVLEASYLVHLLRPFHRNLGKRLVKTPKLHFTDSGLLCFLLGIRTATELDRHPLRGAVFESWVVSEVLKSRLHRGVPPRLSFYRDQPGLEVDLVVEEGRRVEAVEIKSGQTIASDALASLVKFRERWSGERIPLRSWLVYGGDTPQNRSGARVLPWRGISSLR
jgi:uncharacterized protein